MGVANDVVGVMMGFALSIVYCLVMIVALLALRSMAKAQEESPAV